MENRNTGKESQSKQNTKYPALAKQYKFIHTNHIIRAPLDVFMTLTRIRNWGIVFLLLFIITSSNGLRLTLYDLRIIWIITIYN